MKATIVQVSTDGIRLRCEGSVEILFPREPSTDPDGRALPPSHGCGAFMFEVRNTPDMQREFHVGRELALTVEPVVHESK